MVRRSTGSNDDHRHRLTRVSTHNRLVGTTDSIYKKWKSRVLPDGSIYFRRFMHHSREHDECCVVYVSLQQALAHLHDPDWVTDLRDGLSKKENKILDSPGFVSETLRQLPPIRSWSDVLTSSIIYKWSAQGSFIRFIDGNPRNCSFTNLMYVNSQAAMEHIDDWKARA